MKAEQALERRRVLMRHSAEDRERLIREQAQSGLTKKAYCAQKQIRPGTFYSWTKKHPMPARKPVFAQVEMPGFSQAAVEVLLPNGARIGIRHQGRRDELVSLVRGVAGYSGGV